MLGIQRRSDLDEAQRKRLRQRVHLSYAALFLLMVMVFKWADSPSMIGLILKLASYTYGPLLGLFAFGMLTKRQVYDAAVPWVACAAPVLCFLIDANQASLFGAYQIGLELLLLNGGLTFLGLWLVSSQQRHTKVN